MSFGFSVGDFVAATQLIAEICSCLRSSSTSEYRELVVELHNLKRALDEIEHLKCVPDQIAAVTAVKVAALTCRFPLDEFATKIRRFECLEKQGTLSRPQRINLWKRKLEWGFTMEEDLQRFRTYLMAHVGSLNMRLMTLGLATQITLSETATETKKSMEDGLAATQLALQTIQQRLDMQNSRFDSFITMVTTNLIPMLLHMARKVWTSNMKLMSIITWQQNTLQSPVLNHGWLQLQLPVWFEDACGRKLPIPSEYNWGKVHAIILDQFRNGPGKDKVSFGEYDLYDTTNGIRKISSLDHDTLLPGTSITMAMRVGMYQYSGCPTPGCKSNAIIAKDEKVKRCPRCGVWYSITREAPPRPFRTLESKFAEQKTITTTDSGFHKCDDPFKQLRIERMAFKNVQIHMIDLTALQAIFTSGQVVTNSDYQTSAWSEQEQNKSPISFEYPSESQLSPSTSAHKSFLEVSPKMNYNYPCAPGWSSKRVWNFIADESGIDVSDLSPTARFDSMGIDSLLSLTIVGQLRDAGLDIPSSVFWDFPTVQEFEAFLEPLDCPANLQASSLSGNASSSALNYKIDSNR